jgi:hypothetical protein
MFEGVKWRDIIWGAIALTIATALIILGVKFTLHRFVLDNPYDPLTKQGGLKPEQRIDR